MSEKKKKNSRSSQSASHKKKNRRSNSSVHKNKQTASNHAKIASADFKLVKNTVSSKNRIITEKKSDDSEKKEEATSLKENSQQNKPELSADATKTVSLKESEKQSNDKADSSTQSIENKKEKGLKETKLDIPAAEEKAVLDEEIKSKKHAEETVVDGNSGEAASEGKNDSVKKAESISTEDILEKTESKEEKKSNDTSEHVQEISTESHKTTAAASKAETVSGTKEDHPDTESVPLQRPVPSSKQVLKEADDLRKKDRKKNKTEDTIGLPVLDQIITPQDFVPQFEDEISGEKAAIPESERWIHPLECMMKQAVSGIHDTPGRSFLGILVKFLLAGLGITLSTGHMLNKEPFGMARMTFSDGSWLVARIVICGFITELLCIAVKAMIGGRKFTKDGYGRLRDIQGEAAPTIGLLGLISGLLMMVSPVCSFVGWLITFSYGVTMRAYSFELAFRSSRKKTLTAIMAEALVSAILIMLWCSLLGQDVLRVMESFFAF